VGAGISISKGGVPEKDQMPSKGYCPLPAEPPHIGVSVGPFGLDYTPANPFELDSQDKFDTHFDLSHEALSIGGGENYGGGAWIY
jgi:hypothetical protein